VVRAPGRWASPPGRFYLRARSLACDLGANGAPARRERKGGPRKGFSSQDRAYRRGLGFFLRSKTRRAALKAEFQGALAWTTAGARLLPLRAPSRFASQRTQRNRNGQCFKPWGSAHVATGGSRSLLPGCFVRWVTHRASERPFRAVCGTHGSTSLGRSVARAAELRPARQLDGVLQGEGGRHQIPGGEREKRKEEGQVDHERGEHRECDRKQGIEPRA
jgi:hypothetical protein